MPPQDVALLVLALGVICYGFPWFMLVLLLVFGVYFVVQVDVRIRRTLNG
jgi:hypothetical protein